MSSPPPWASALLTQQRALLSRTSSLLSTLRTIVPPSSSSSTPSSTKSPPTDTSSAITTLLSYSSSLLTPMLAHCDEHVRRVHAHVESTHSFPYDMPIPSHPTSSRFSTAAPIPPPPPTSSFSPDSSLLTSLNASAPTLSLTSGFLDLATTATPATTTTTVLPTTKSTPSQSLRHSLALLLLEARAFLYARTSSPTFEEYLLAHFPYFARRVSLLKSPLTRHVPGPETGPAVLAVLQFAAYLLHEAALRLPANKSSVYDLFSFLLSFPSLISRYVGDWIVPCLDSAPDSPTYALLLSTPLVHSPPSSAASILSVIRSASGSGESLDLAAARAMVAGFVPLHLLHDLHTFSLLHDGLWSDSSLSTVQTQSEIFVAALSMRSQLEERDTGSFGSSGIKDTLAESTPCLKYLSSAFWRDFIAPIDDGTVRSVHHIDLLVMHYHNHSLDKSPDTDVVRLIENMCRTALSSPTTQAGGLWGALGLLAACSHHTRVDIGLQIASDFGRGPATTATAVVTPSATLIREFTAAFIKRNNLLDAATRATCDATQSKCPASLRSLLATVRLSDNKLPISVLLSLAVDAGALDKEIVVALCEAVDTLSLHDAATLDSAINGWVDIILRNNSKFADVFIEHYAAIPVERAASSQLVRWANALLRSFGQACSSSTSAPYERADRFLRLVLTKAVECCRAAVQQADSSFQLLKTNAHCRGLVHTASLLRQSLASSVAAHQLRLTAAQAYNAQYPFDELLALLQSTTAEPSPIIALTQADFVLRLLNAIAQDAFSSSGQFHASGVHSDAPLFSVIPAPTLVTETLRFARLLQQHCPTSTLSEASLDEPSYKMCSQLLITLSSVVNSCLSFESLHLLWELVTNATSEPEQGSYVVVVRQWCAFQESFGLYILRLLEQLLEPSSPPVERFGVTFIEFSVHLVASLNASLPMTGKDTIEFIGLPSPPFPYSAVTGVHVLLRSIVESGMRLQREAGPSTDSPAFHPAWRAAVHFVIHAVEMSEDVLGARSALLDDLGALTWQREPPSHEAALIGATIIREYIAYQPACVVLDAQVPDVLTASFPVRRGAAPLEVLAAVGLEAPITVIASIGDTLADATLAYFRSPTCAALLDRGGGDRRFTTVGDVALTSPLQLIPVGINGDEDRVPRSSHAPHPWASAYTGTDSYHHGWGGFVHSVPEPVDVAEAELERVTSLPPIGHMLCHSDTGLVQSLLRHISGDETLWKLHDAVMSLPPCSALRDYVAGDFEGLCADDPRTLMPSALAADDSIALHVGCGYVLEYLCTLHQRASTHDSLHWLEAFAARGGLECVASLVRQLLPHVDQSLSLQCIKTALQLLNQVAEAEVQGSASGLSPLHVLSRALLPRSPVIIGADGQPPDFALEQAYQLSVPGSLAPATLVSNAPLDADEQAESHTHRRRRRLRRNRRFRRTHHHGTQNTDSLSVICTTAREYKLGKNNDYRQFVSPEQLAAPAVLGNVDHAVPFRGVADAVLQLGHSELADAALSLWGTSLLCSDSSLSTEAVAALLRPSDDLTERRLLEVFRLASFGATLGASVFEALIMLAAKKTPEPSTEASVRASGLIVRLLTRSELEVTPEQSQMLLSSLAEGIHAFAADPQTAREATAREFEQLATLLALVPSLAESSECRDELKRLLDVTVKQCLLPAAVDGECDPINLADALSGHVDVRQLVPAQAMPALMSRDARRAASKLVQLISALDTAWAQELLAWLGQVGAEGLELSEDLRGGKIVLKEVEQVENGAELRYQPIKKSSSPESLTDALVPRLVDFSPRALENDGVVVELQASNPSLGWLVWAVLGVPVLRQWLLEQVEDAGAPHSWKQHLARVVALLLGSAERHVRSSVAMAAYWGSSTGIDRSKSQRDMVLRLLEGVDELEEQLGVSVITHTVCTECGEAADSHTFEAIKSLSISTALQEKHSEQGGGEVHVDLSEMLRSLQRPESGVMSWIRRAAGAEMGGNRLMRPTLFGHCDHCSKSCELNIESQSLAAQETVMFWFHYTTATGSAPLSRNDDEPQGEPGVVKLPIELDVDAKGEQAWTMVSLVCGADACEYVFVRLPGGGDKWAMVVRDERPVPKHEPDREARQPCALRSVVETKDLPLEFALLPKATGFGSTVFEPVKQVYASQDWKQGLVPFSVVYSTAEQQPVLLDGPVWRWLTRRNMCVARNSLCLDASYVKMVLRVLSLPGGEPEAYLEATHSALLILEEVVETAGRARSRFKTESRVMVRTADDDWTRQSKQSLPFVKDEVQELGARCEEDANVARRVLWLGVELENRRRGLGMSLLLLGRLLPSALSGCGEGVPELVHGVVQPLCESAHTGVLLKLTDVRRVRHDVVAMVLQAVHRAIGDSLLDVELFAKVQLGIEYPDEEVSLPVEMQVGTEELEHKYRSMARLLLGARHALGTRSCFSLVPGQLGLGVKLLEKWCFGDERASELLLDFLGDGNALKELAVGVEATGVWNGDERDFLTPVVHALLSVGAVEKERGLGSRLATMRRARLLQVLCDKRDSALAKRSKADGYGYNHDHVIQGHLDSVEAALMYGVRLDEELAYLVSLDEALAKSTLRSGLRYGDHKSLSALARGFALHKAKRWVTFCAGIVCGGPDTSLGRLARHSIFDRNVLGIVDGLLGPASADFERVCDEVDVGGRRGLFAAAMGMSTGASTGASAGWISFAS